MWSSKYADCEKSAKGSRAHLKQKGSQLQPTEAAFSEVNFQGREQPPLQWTNAAFSVGCPTHEARRGCEQRETKAAKGSSAYMEQTSPKLQQKNASFSAGMKPQGQPKEAAISVGNNKEQKKGVSQWGKGASNGIHETHEEFVCKFREKLQEFAMILNKKYHYNFPTEYFDDYRGSFNKEEFLGIKCSNEKSRRQEADESAMKEEGDVMKIADFQPCDSIFSNSNNYGGLDQGVWSKEGLKEHIGSFREEEMMETTNQKTEMARGNKESRGLVINSAAVIEELEEEIILQEASTERLQGKFDGVLDQKFVGNGVTLGQENLIEGPAIYTDIGAGILPPILDLPEAKSGNTCNIYPRLGLDCGGPHAIKESPKYTAPLSLDPKKAESSLARVKIGIRQPPVRVLAGRLREIAEEVEDFAKGNKTPAAVLLFTSTSKSMLLSTAWKDELLAEIEVATAPNAKAYKQPWYEYPRQFCNLPLLHLEDAVDNFQCAAVVHHGGVGTTAVGIKLEFYQLASIEVLGRITTGIDLGILRTKKKKPRRRKREKEIKQKMKVGVG